jgi:hypothetical protein
VTAIASAENDISEVRSAIETANAYSFTQVPALLSTLAAKQQSNANHISALATAQMKAPENEYESELVRVIAHLSRANQFFLHANYGLAEDQLIAAQQILLNIEGRVDHWHKDQTLDLLTAIEGAMIDLPDHPTLANGKLDLAWQLALQGLQSPPSQDLAETPSPTPGVILTPTPTQN